jgi:hypothetical protein
MVSHREGIDSVVFLVSAAEPHSCDLGGVIELHDEAIVVAADVEDDAAISDYVRGSEQRFHLRGLAPGCLLYLTSPGSKPTFQGAAQPGQAPLLAPDKCIEDVGSDDDHSDKIEYSGFRYKGGVPKSGT